MKLNSIVLLLVSSLSLNLASVQQVATPTIGEVVQPSGEPKAAGAVQGRTFGLIAGILGGTLNLLFGGRHSSGGISYNGSNLYYGSIGGYYCLFSPSVQYVNNWDGTYTLYIYNFYNIGGRGGVAFTCPSYNFRINRSGQGYYCQIKQEASCRVQYL